MNVEIISFEKFDTLRADEKARHCNAIIGKCRRAGVLVHGTFYYQTPDRKCFRALSYEYIVEDLQARQNEEDRALEEL